MYIKNPNLNSTNFVSKTITTTTSRLSTAVDPHQASADEKSFLIEPSPSGVTRIRINNFDAANANQPGAAAFTPTAAGSAAAYSAVSQQRLISFKPPPQPNVFVEFNQQQQTQLPRNQSNKMIDICTSPIKIFNANSAVNDHLDAPKGNFLVSAKD